MSTVIELTMAEVVDNPFPKFYDLMIDKLDFSKSNPKIKVNCTKISVSQQIQDAWYTHYPESKHMDLSMQLLASGPKVFEELDGFKVEVFPGFISFDEDKVVNDCVFDGLMQFLDALPPGQGGLGNLYGLDEMLNEDPELPKEFEVDIDEKYSKVSTVCPRIEDVCVDEEENVLKFSLCYKDDNDNILEQHSYLLSLKEVPIEI